MRVETAHEWGARVPDQWKGPTSQREMWGLGFGVVGYLAVWAMKSIRYCFQTMAWVWVPWPRVASEMGIRMNFAWGIRVTIFSAMPSSGGLMKSSVELIQRTGAVMVESFGSGL